MKNLKTKCYSQIDFSMADLCSQLASFETNVVVGCFIIRSGRKVFLHRRSINNKFMPGIWGIVAGKVQVGESKRKAIYRELHEETGWHVERVCELIGMWRWSHENKDYCEYDYIVKVRGDLDRPMLELGKSDCFAWVREDQRHILLQGRRPNDRALFEQISAVFKKISLGNVSLSI